MEETIEDLMREVINRKNPMVYDVSLSKKDHSTLWIAYAYLRADGRNFSVEHENPKIALIELNLILDSLICPYCHQLKKEEQEDV